MSPSISSCAGVLLRHPVSGSVFVRWFIPPKLTLKAVSARAFMMDPVPSQVGVPAPEVASSLPPTSAGSTTYNGKSYTIVREGLAEILNPQAKEEGDAARKPEEPKHQTVFYNPIQQFNRDLSVLAIRVFGDDLAVRRAKQLAAPNGPRGKKRKRVKEDDGSSARGGNNSSTGDGEANAKTNGAPEVTEDQPVVETNALRVSRFRILDALSASGLRAIRYAKEIPMTTSVTANDLSPEATAAIKLNVFHNNVSDKVNAITGDAQAHMHSVASPLTRGRQSLYEVIDLDPYGTAAPFLDAAVRAVTDGGLLCVTCTDAGVFASLGYLEKTYSQYGGLPFKGQQSHEAGLRLILHAIAACAARYGLSIEPLLSLSIDFYARVFVRIRRSPAEVKFLASKTMVVYNCDEGCGAWTTQFLSQSRAKKAKNGDTIYKFSLAQGPSATQYCQHCDIKTHLSGPMWGGPIHNPYFVHRILDILPSLSAESYGTIPRIEGMLSVALEESVSFTTQPCSPTSQAPDDSASPPPNDNLQPFTSLDPSIRATHPFFILTSSLAKILHTVSPSDAAFRGALAHLGYRTSRSHTKPGSICTDAPWSVIWEIMREWVRQKAPVKSDAIKEGTAGWGIMRRDRSKVQVNEVKRLFRERIEKCEGIREVETEIEAALWRLKEMEGGGRIGPDGSLTKEADAPNLQSPNAVPGESTHRLKIVFDESLGKEHQRGKRLVRYQINPRADWGPMNRAKGG